MKFSLVIPCYNEARNLPLLIDRCDGLAGVDGVEVVLVDNGSTDDSPEVLARLLSGRDSIRTIRVEENEGYGQGILSGLRAARGEFLGWTHADMQTDPMDCVQGLDILDASSVPTFVKGRRHGRPIGDVVFTMGMSVFETALLRRRLWDINAQPTMFSRTFFESWDEQAPKDFSLDLYAYYTARRMGLRVVRFPVKFGERAHGTSHWNVDWSAKRRFIRRTVDFSLQLRKDLP